MISVYYYFNKYFDRFCGIDWGKYHAPFFFLFLILIRTQTCCCLHYCNGYTLSIIKERRSLNEVTTFGLIWSERIRISINWIRRCDSDKHRRFYCSRSQYRVTLAGCSGKCSKATYLLCAVEILCRFNDCVKYAASMSVCPNIWINIHLLNSSEFSSHFPTKKMQLEDCQNSCSRIFVFRCLKKTNEPQEFEYES